MLHRKIYVFLYYALLLFAVVSLLNALIIIFMHYGIKQEYSTKYFMYFIHGFAIAIYLIIAVVFVFFLRKKDEDWPKKKIPTFLFFLVAVVAVALSHIFKYLSNQRLESYYEDLTFTNYMSKLNLNLLFDIVDHAIFVAQAITLILLGLYLILQLRSKISS